jgi:hypothetical protein
MAFRLKPLLSLISRNKSLFIACRILWIGLWIKLALKAVNPGYKSSNIRPIFVLKLVFPGIKRWKQNMNEFSLTQFGPLPRMRLENP